MVEPFEGPRERHLHVFRKTRLRRSGSRGGAGMAAKRPLGWRSPRRIGRRPLQLDPAWAGCSGRRHASRQFTFGADPPFGIERTGSDRPGT